LARLSRTARWLTGAAALSGLLLIPMALRAPGYFGMVQLHVLVSAALLPAAVIAAGAWAWPRRRRPLALLPFAVLGVVVWNLSAPAALVWNHAPLGYESLSELVWSAGGDTEANRATMAALIAIVGALVSILAPRSASRWSLAAAVTSMTVALVTGAQLLLTVPRVPGLDAVHSFAGVLAAWALVAYGVSHALADRWRDRGLAAVAATAVVAVTLLAWTLWYRHEHGRLTPALPGEPGLVLASTPASRAELLAPDRASIPAELLGDSMSCGAERCHPIETAQWAGSNHRFAADNRVFRKVVEDMVAELGPDSAGACTSCHDPVRTLAGTALEAWGQGPPPPEGEGVSCVVCHAMSAVPDTPRNGIMTVAAPRPYPGSDREARHRHILLDPREHARTLFRRTVLLDDTSCGTCHRLEAGPELWMATDLRLSIPYDPQQRYAPDNPGHDLACADCHMPVTSTAREDEGLYIYDHQMPALNPDMPLYAIGPGAEDLAVAEASDYATSYLRGALSDRTADDLEVRADDRLDPDLRAADVQARGALLRIDLDASFHQGQLTVTVTTHNHRSAHVYPSGSRDFRQVWQEVIVRDAHGVERVHVGGLDEGGRLDPTARRLGATVLDLEGRPLGRHRVWEAVGVTGVRSIEPGGSVQDEYRWELPADTATPCTVTARWNLRHASAAFTQYVFEDPSFRFPVHPIGEAVATTGP
jgi:hypothetical protein